MLRNGLACVLLVIALVSGCQKSPDQPRQAQQAVGGLMPAGEPGVDLEYVADQKQVKLLPAREVSYEPLDVFRKANAAAAMKHESASPMAKSDAAEPSSEVSDSSSKPPETAEPDKTAATSESGSDEADADESAEQSDKAGADESSDDETDEAAADESSDHADEADADSSDEQVDDGDE